MAEHEGINNFVTDLWDRMEPLNSDVLLIPAGFPARFFRQGKLLKGTGHEIVTHEELTEDLAALGIVGQNYTSRFIYKPEGGRLEFLKFEVTSEIEFNHRTFEFRTVFKSYR